MQTKSKQSLSVQQFLEKENTQLKSRLSQSQQLLNLNKSALRASIDYVKQRIPLKQLVNTLYQENTKLKECLDRSYQDWNQTNSKLLISHQLVRAGEINQKQLIDQLKDKIYQLKNVIKEKEKTITQLEKTTTSYDSENALHVKLVEISAPNILTIKFHQDIEELRMALATQAQELEKSKQRCSDLLKMNMVLTKQLNDSRTHIRLSGHKHNKNSTQFSQMLEYHEKIMNQSQDSFEDMSDQQQSQNKITRPSPVPKLELSKAKQIQQIIVKKINVQERKKSKDQQGLIKTEQMITLKKVLNKQLIKNIGLEKKVTNLNRVVSELQERNQMLLRAIGSYQKEEVTVIGSILNLETTDDDLHQARQDIIQMGREVYLNQNLDKVIHGEAVPTLARDWSKSVMFDGDYNYQY